MQNGDPRSGQAAVAPTSAAPQPSDAVGAPLAGRRDLRVAEPTVGAASQSAIDAARAHARARAQAQQAASRGESDGDYRPSPAALAAAAARAATAAAAETRARELRPRTPKRHDRFGGLHALQIVAVEIALVAGIAFSRHELVVMIPVMVAAVLVVLGAVGRHRGKWLYEWLFLALRFATRRRKRGIEAEADQAMPFARGLRLENVEIDGEQAGVLRHQGGFTTILEPTHEDGPGRAAGHGLLPPLGQLLPSYSESSPQVTVQVLVHTIPAPGQLTAEDAAAASYAELAGGTIPAQRRMLIAVQAQHVPGTFVAADLDNALANAVRRIKRKLAKAGFRVDALNQAAALDEFGGVVRGALGDDSERVAVREGWREWQAGSARHVTYRIVGWPNLADETGARLVEFISAAPSLDTTVAIAARNVGGVIQVEAAVRLQSADGGASDATRAALREVVERCGATLERLDGRHAFGMNASVPVGGFAA